MKKFIEDYCKQNPKIPIPCANPKCEEETLFKSKGVFKKKTFEFDCPLCGETTEFPSEELEKKILSELKKHGITLR